MKDKKEGYGIYFWPDGRKYSGRWKNGKQHGLGTYQDKNGIIYKGTWKNGKKLVGVDNK